MKTTAASIIAFVAASCFSSLAMAADETVKMAIKDGLEAGKHTKRTLGGDIALYFGPQKTPAVTKKIGEWTSSQKSMRHSRQEACDTAFVSALLSLQDRARREGGNAVINISSTIGDSSATEYSCIAGRVTAHVQLRGTVVTLKK
jgi:uncharacterized protein YbjQ (UPF0145 family)